MLNEIYNSCRDVANQLRGWQKMSKNDIANLYLDSRGTERGNVYAAALLCHYWYKVGLLWKNNSNAMTQEDCYRIVWDGIEKAMNYAPWRNKDNSLFEDPNGPDKAINVCIESERKNYYGFSNRDKRKVNHNANSQSLDSLYESTKDYSINLIDESELIYNDSTTGTLYIDLMIDKLIQNDKLPEAIILDTICYNDSITTSVINGVRTNRFSERKLITTIHNLDDTYINYFSKSYGVDCKLVIDCVCKINSLSYMLLHKLLNRTLYVITHLEDYKFLCSWN